MELPNHSMRPENPMLKNLLMEDGDDGSESEDELRFNTLSIDINRSNNIGPRENSSDSTIGSKRTYSDELVSENWQSGGMRQRDHPNYLEHRFNHELSYLTDSHASYEKYDQSQTCGESTPYGDPKPGSFMTPEKDDKIYFRSMSPSVFPSNTQMCGSSYPSFTEHGHSHLAPVHFCTNVSASNALASQITRDYDTFNHGENVGDLSLEDFR